MEIKEKEQAKLFLESTILDFNDKRFTFEKTESWYQENKKAVEQTFNNIKKILKNFSDDTVNIRHLVTKDGVSVLEIRQGDIVKFIRTKFDIECVGGCWSTFVWAKLFCGQKQLIRNIMYLDELLKTISNVKFNTERMNILYYPYIDSKIYMDKEDKEHQLLLLKYSSMHFEEFNIDEHIDFEEEKKKYLDIFSWVKKDKDYKNWFLLYNQDAGKELFLLLGINRIIEYWHYYKSNYIGKSIADLQEEFSYNITMFPDYEVCSVLDKPIYNIDELVKIYKFVFYKVYKDWIKEMNLAQFLFKPSVLQRYIEKERK